MYTGNGRKRFAGLALGLVIAVTALTPFAASAFDVVAGATGNSLNLRIFQGAATQGTLTVEVVGAPSWITSLTPSSQVASSSSEADGMTEVSLSFDVDAAVVVGTEGDLDVRIRSLERSGIDAVKSYHLIVQPSAAEQQQILTEDCCAVLVSPTTYVGVREALLFSIPVVAALPANGFTRADAFDDDFGAGQTFYSTRVWSPATGAITLASSFPNGRGFFLRDVQGTTGDSTQVDVSGGALGTASPWTVAGLDSGFQEIGNPYLADIAWDASIDVTLGATTVPLDSAVALGWLEPTMWKVQGRPRSTPQMNWQFFDVRDGDGVIRAWEGAMILPRVDGLSITYPGAGLDSHLSGPALEASIGRLRAQVAALGFSDDQNYFGFAYGASNQNDNRDVLNPFNLDGYVELYFNNASWPVKPGTYMQDIRPPQAAVVSWPIGVVVAGSASQSVTITWPDLSDLSFARSIRLIDPAVPDTTDMRAETSYTFTSGAAGSVRALTLVLDATATDVAGPRADVPATFMLGMAQPNPFGSRTEIRYGVPAQGGQVAVRVYNVAGQLVKTLVDGHVAAGFHRAVWDGRNENGEAAKAGVYFYRLETPTMRETRKMTLLW